jgi:hypothetical protein
MAPHFIHTPPTERRLGRQVAVQLAALGVSRLTLIDHDVVERHDAGILCSRLETPTVAACYSREIVNPRSGGSRVGTKSKLSFDSVAGYLDDIELPSACD